jgi:hypothetical protein
MKQKAPELSKITEKIWEYFMNTESCMSQFVFIAWKLSDYVILYINFSYIILLIIQKA